jgi:hypothetical protein
LAHRGAALPISAGIRDGTSVEDQEKGNFDILCFHVWLHAGVCIMDSIFNFLEQNFNGVLEVDWHCHLVVIFGKLRWVDEPISLFQVHENLKCQVIGILQEVIFKLGIVNSIIRF